MKVTHCQAPGCSNPLDGIAQRSSRLYCGSACNQRAWYSRHRAAGDLPEKRRGKRLTSGDGGAIVREGHVGPITQEG